MLVSRRTGFDSDLITGYQLGEIQMGKEGISSADYGDCGFDRTISSRRLRS